MRLLKEKKEQKINHNEIYHIPPYLIKPNPQLSRTDFPDTSLISLADSIRKYGVLQPLVVHCNTDGKYELIAGERRLRACVLLKCPTVPCVIIDKNESTGYLSIVENMQQEKLNMFDVSKSLSRIINSCAQNVEEGARLLSMSREELLKKLKLQNFTRAEMQAILNLGISEEKANILVDFPKVIRYEIIKLSAENELSCNILTRLLAEILMEDKKISTGYDIGYLKNILYEIYQSEEILKNKGKNESNQNEQNGKTVVVLKDLQLFENTIKKNCEILKKSGFEVEFISEYSENNTSADYIIGVKKIDICPDCE